MKNIKAIEQIYYNLEKLDDDYADLPETESAHKSIMDYLERNNFFGDSGNGNSKKKLNFGDLMCAATAASERQGFIYGFQYAIKLLIGEGCV